MNAERCAMVQNLISNLDDSRIMYLALKPLLGNPHARSLLSQVISLHSATAGDLARQMRLTGGVQAHRGGSIWGRLGAQAARLAAIASTDCETACLKRVARHEDRVTQRFQATIAHVQDLHPRLHCQLLTLERIYPRIELLAHK